MMIRDQVFISYSRKDKKWLEEIESALKVLEYNHQVVVWSDTKIKTGDKWQKEIESAIKKCKVAILLVSKDFLASTFIVKKELPQILSAAEKEGLVIYNIIIDHNSYHLTDLIVYECLNDPKYPLKHCNDRQNEETYVKLTNSLYAQINESRNEGLPLEEVCFPAILILKYLVSNGEKSFSEINKATSVKRSIINTMLTELVKKNYIERVELGKKKKPSVLWRASALGVTIFNRFDETYNLLASASK